MKILLVPYQYPNVYNLLSANYCQRQAESLAACGHEVSVLAVAQAPVKWIIKSGKIRFGLDRYRKNNVNTFVYVIPACPFLQRLDLWIIKIIGLAIFRKYFKKDMMPDVIHLHIFFAGSLALALSEKYKIPFFVTEHSSNFALGLVKGWREKLAGKIFRSSAGNIAVSAKMCSLLSDRYGVKFNCIPNVVDTSFFTPDFSGKKQNEFVFINIGNLIKLKNQELLIRSFKSIFQKYSYARLIIIGEGPEHDFLQTLVDENGLNEVVKIENPLDPEGIRDRLRTSDCFVLCSKYETFGIVIIEAMSCCLPVIATRCGGPESIITDKSFGILCEDNSESLVDAMTVIIKERDNFSPENIRKHVEANFSMNAVANNIISLYES
jgi:L-malate glycosyltransferase